MRDTRDLFTVSETIGNGDLKYPVGLLTQDEAYLAGGRVSVMNQKYYLRTGSYYWLLSPYYLASSNGFSRSWFVYSTGNLDANPSTAAYGTRPVINIRGDVVIDSGTGTVSSPFAISL